MPAAADLLVRGVGVARVRKGWRPIARVCGTATQGRVYDTAMHADGGGRTRMHDPMRCMLEGMRRARMRCARVV